MEHIANVCVCIFFLYVNFILRSSIVSLMWTQSNHNCNTCSQLQLLFQHFTNTEMLRYTLEPPWTVHSKRSEWTKYVVQEISRVSRRYATRDRRSHLTNPSNIARRVFPRMPYRLPVLFFSFTSLFWLSTEHGESSRAQLQFSCLAFYLPLAFF